MITNTFSLNFTSTEIENERTFGGEGGVLENKQGWRGANLRNLERT